ncbi:hypothetical protein MADA3029_420168 [Vibrio nigripulchritudo MADA3029]|nr:hypothetical protein VIBNIMADA3020_160169 [Vibrio nigripulchritudo MADA3020]CCN54521.1 hypothetical protein VIBNIMADA3021_560008 [Vibrio nigripulchritudo MADA3021]CCN59560.1 hypothetical protein MADA3029_420168 [Vibrio nigripulchritudo MADA3029]
MLGTITNDMGSPSLESATFEVLSINFGDTISNSSYFGGIYLAN